MRTKNGKVEITEKKKQYLYIYSRKNVLNVKLNKRRTLEVPVLVEIFQKRVDRRWLNVLFLSKVQNIKYINKKYVYKR